MDLLAGRNLMAVLVSDGNWELVQFENAELLPSGKYLLGNIIRGQGGTEKSASWEIPIGAEIVFLDSGISTFEVPEDRLGLAINYKYGPANLAVSDAAYRDLEFSTKRISTRPYSPAHLKVDKTNGDFQLSWLRRSRGGTDVWNTAEVPLKEASEGYIARVLVGGVNKRSWNLSEPNVIYSVGQMSIDGVVTDFEFEVAQVSESFGAGPALRKVIYV